MIDWNSFERIVLNEVGRDISTVANKEQHDAISEQTNTSLFIVAGPGSGKTTVLTLRILKIIYVDSVDPGAILATTFTKKAAEELRSRILGWGDRIKRTILHDANYEDIHHHVKSLDINRVRTGTLDSIAEEILKDNRSPGTPAPVVVEDFVANALMTNAGLFANGGHRDSELKDYIASLRGGSFGLNIPKLSESLRNLKDRFHHDQVDQQAYLAHATHLGANKALDAISKYESELDGRLLYDFARVENEFLSKLNDGSLQHELASIYHILIDEYQDTNLLQEQIYFCLSRAAIGNGGSVSVVGDDDQSLYRFRGATVDLFLNFPLRLNNYLGVTSNLVYLSRNYRSTNNIVDFCNDFLYLDSTYQSARVPGKPPISPSRRPPFDNYPVLGIFRDSVEELAQAVGDFIHNVVHGQGVHVVDRVGNPFSIKVDGGQGSAGDIVLLSSSPRELDSQGRPRLPLLLRHHMDQQQPATHIFNPRGQELKSVFDVECLCGLLLECIDPGEVVQNSNRFPLEAITTFAIWRQRGIAYYQSNPSPTQPSLGDFVSAWAHRCKIDGSPWDKRVPVMEIIYKLVSWIPSMQSDIEGLVYLEAISRTITQSALFTNFSGEIVFDRSDPGLEQASIKEAYWNIFVPLATGAIDTNEDLLDTLPRDRINIMSVHQAKGLEFPLVIVDVGSDFKTEHWTQQFKRHPRSPSEPCMLEDELRGYSPLGLTARNGIDRAFDDLIRQYFVAYSRAQDALILVGLSSVSNGYSDARGRQKYIPNIATGWDRNASWHWGQGLNNLVHL